MKKYYTSEGQAYYKKPRTKAPGTPVHVAQTGPYYLSRVTHTKKGRPLSTKGPLIKLVDRRGRYIQWVNEEQAGMLIQNYPQDIFWLTQP